MSIGEFYDTAYQKAIGLAPGWIVNWPLETRVPVGRVGRFKRDWETGLWGFVPGNTLQGVGISYKVNPDMISMGDSNIAYGRDSSIEFGFDAKVPGWEWLGNAKAGFHASFGSDGGVRAQVSNVRREEAESIDALAEDLLTAAKNETLDYGQVIIVERETGDMGTIVGSEYDSGEMKVAAEGDFKPAGAVLAKFSAGFNVRMSSGAAFMRAVDSPFTVSYRALIVGSRGIWWWKRPVIEGLVEMTDDELIRQTEEGLSERDFLAIY